MTKTTTFVLSVLLAATSPISSVSNAASTASLYVAKHGSDSYSCAQAANPSTPKLTIMNALQNCFSTGAGASANRTLEVAAGTYAEALFPGNGFPKGSSWSAPFTLRAKAGDTVIIRPNSGYPLYITDNDTGVPGYIVIQGFTFDAINAGVDNVAIFSSHVRMVGNELINNHFGGVIAGRDAFEFINNKIHGGIFDSRNNPGGAYLYPIYYGGNGGLIDGNEIWDFPSYGFHIYKYGGGPSDNIVRNNILRDWGWAINCPGGDARCQGRPSDHRGQGIVVEGPRNAVYNNLVYNGLTAINLGTWGNSQAYNNTIYNMRIGGLLSNASTNQIVRNNIVVNPTAPRDGDIRSWQSPDTTTYSNNMCARADTGCSVVADPLFFDPASGNFSIQSGSAAAGMGAALY